MVLEDYAPYIALNLPLGYFGPAPRPPSSCACGRYIVDDFCMCASSCRSMQKYKWAKENPEAYKAEQAEEHKWRIRCNLWNEQRNKVDDMIYRKSLHIRKQFVALQDAESEMGCYECEEYGYSYCRCECEGCGNKWCCGSCCDEEDYDY